MKRMVIGIGALAALAAVAGSWMLLQEGGLPPPPPPAAGVAEPIAAIGHGAALGADGRSIKLTPAFVREAQNHYLGMLYARADAETKARFDELRQSFESETGLDEEARSLIDAALIDWLIANVRPADADTLKGKNNLMKHFLQARMASRAGGPTPFGLSPALAARLNALVPAAGPSGPEATAAYLAECAAAGVPTPPDWGTSGWVSKGVLDNEFIETELEAEVFVYDSRSPRGLCIALPRSTGASIDLLGIICLGQASSKACFFDNQVDDRQLPIPRGEVRRITQFAGGRELEDGAGGECTACHVGENPFVIHPNTPLGLPALRGLTLRGAAWYRPIVSPNWHQNDGPAEYPEPEGSVGSCADCHTAGSLAGGFPAFSPALVDKYCSNVLANAIRQTMPPGRPGHPDYAAHAASIQQACNRGR